MAHILNTIHLISDSRIPEVNYSGAQCRGAFTPDNAQEEHGEACRDAQVTLIYTIIRPIANGQDCTLVTNRTYWVTCEAHKSCSENGVQPVDNWNVFSHSPMLWTYDFIRQQSVVDDNKATIS